MTNYSETFDDFSTNFDDDFDFGIRTLFEETVGDFYVCSSVGPDSSKLIKVSDGCGDVRDKIDDFCEFANFVGFSDSSLQVPSIDVTVNRVSAVQTLKAPRVRTGQSGGTVVWNGAEGTNAVVQVSIIQLQSSDNVDEVLQSLKAPMVYGGHAGEIVLYNGAQGMDADKNLRFVPDQRPQSLNQEEINFVEDQCDVSVLRDLSGATDDDGMRAEFPTLPGSEFEMKNLNLQTCRTVYEINVSDLMRYETDTNISFMLLPEKQMVYRDERDDTPSTMLDHSDWDLPVPVIRNWKKRRKNP